VNFALNVTLVVVVSCAAFFDIKERRIPNLLIVVGLSGGILIAYLQGNSHVFSSIIGFFAGLFGLLLPFAFRWMGAGDVKLFATVGTLIGYTLLPRVFFYSCITAGTIALLGLVIGYVKQVSFIRFWNDCKFMFLTMRSGLPQATAINAGAYSVPWGVAIGAGTIMAYYLDPSGTWAGF
jgi:prepilin peptidase CpaA